MVPTHGQRVQHSNGGCVKGEGTRLFGGKHKGMWGPKTKAKRESRMSLHVWKPKRNGMGELTHPATKCTRHQTYE